MVTTFTVRLQGSRVLFAYLPVVFLLALTMSVSRCECMLLKTCSILACFFIMSRTGLSAAKILATDLIAHHHLDQNQNEGELSDVISLQRLHV